MNHTAAERERIEKKRRSRMLVIEVFCVIAVVFFIIFSSRYKNKQAALEAAELAKPTADPWLTDERVIYLKHFAEDGYVAADDAVRLAVTDSSGGPAQLITYFKNSSLNVKYRFGFKLPEKEEEDPFSSLFPTIDDPKATEPAPDHTAEAEHAVGYFLPLVGEESFKQLSGSIRTALDKLYSGGGEGGSKFFIGVYTFEVTYSAEEQTVSVIAAPSD